jgi:hypothetical protein
MKLNVIVDPRGNILGVAQVGTMTTEDGDEIEFGIVPEPGQIIHEVEVADELPGTSPDEVHLRVTEYLADRLPGRRPSPSS